MQNGIGAWYSCLSVQPGCYGCSKIVAQTLESSFQTAYTKIILSLADTIDQTPLPFYLKNMSFCHHTDEFHNCDCTGLGILLLLSLSN